MTRGIDRLIQRYGRFEQQVRQWTETWCRPSCAVCRQVCCRAHFCLEARESAFLACVVDQFSPRSIFTDTCGWLGQQGCTLVAGRPPVCYEFLCRPLVDGVADDPTCQHALRVASMVITHVGKKVLGGRHVVEATRFADLQRIRQERFLSRLDQAEAAFDLAVDVLNARPVNARTDLFAYIAPMPTKNQQHEGD